MNFSLSEDQELLRRSARELLSSEWPGSTMRRMLDDSESASQEIWGNLVIHFTLVGEPSYPWHSRRW